MKLDVVKLEGGTAGSIDLSDEIFGLDPRKDLLHRVVTWQLAKRQQGSHKVKTRGEINYSTKKIVRQKGSGGARHGDRKVSQFRGGTKAHGPVVRSHNTELPKKVRRLALKHALSAKAKAESLFVLDEAKSSTPKTKELAASFEKLGWGNVLVVDAGEQDSNFKLASRNLPNVDVLPVEGINVYDVLRRHNLVLTKAAADKLGENLK